MIDSSTCILHTSNFVYLNRLLFRSIPSWRVDLICFHQTNPPGSSSKKRGKRNERRRTHQLVSYFSGYFSRDKLLCVVSRQILLTFGNFLHRCKELSSHVINNCMYRMIIGEFGIVLIIELLILGSWTTFETSSSSTSVYRKPTCKMMKKEEDQWWQT